MGCRRSPAQPGGRDAWRVAAQIGRDFARCATTHPAPPRPAADTTAAAVVVFYDRTVSRPAFGR